MMQLSGELLAAGTNYPQRYEGPQSAGGEEKKNAHNAETNTWNVVALALERNQIAARISGGVMVVGGGGVCVEGGGGVILIS